VIVNRRRGARRHHEREQAERAIFRTVQRVLADTPSHGARVIRLRELIRQPSVGRKQPREYGPERIDACSMLRNRRHQSMRLVDERADLRRIDDEAEVGLVLMR
jgi:hypothetical protein